MENSVVINQKPMDIKEYKGQRVLTFKDIDTVHGRPYGTARKRFNDNKKHFVEGEDFYKIQPSEIRTVGITSPNGGTVLTESGYLMLAKSLTDELAWKVQRELVNNYFRAKSQQSCRQMTFDDYSYFDKTWGGEPVVTIHDIAHLSGLDRTSIGDTIRRELIEHEEYCLLERKALGQFKAENPKLPRNIPSLIIVNRRGFEHICEIYGLEIEKPKCLAVEEKKRSSQIITPTITRQSEEIRRMAERLIHLTYLLDDTHGQILCGETFHQCRMAVIRQMKEIGSCIVVPRKEN